MTRPFGLRALRRSIWLGAAGIAAAGGLVAAQPAPPPIISPPPPPVIGPQVQASPPPAPALPPAEEGPPQETAPAAPDAATGNAEAETPTPSAPPPPPEQKPAVPLRRARYDVAVLQALDKVTAESLVFEAPVGKPIRYKGLIFTVRACERSTPDEPIEDSIAYLTIDSQPRAEPGLPAPPARQVFKGWMYASSPGLNPLQHPVYDAWVISCRASAPPAVASR